MAVILHLEVEFDTMGSEPQPWWRPFAWVRAHVDANGHWQRVIRVGALGLHLAASIAYSPEEVLDPKG